MPYDSTGDTIDANNITTIGWIKFANNSTNIPEVSNGSWLLTLIHSIGYTMQLVLDRDARVFTRACNSGTWSTWKQLAFLS